MEFTVNTKGHNDIIDITGQVEELVSGFGKSEGVALVFVSGSTAAVTATEYEPGVIKDLQQVLEEIAPESADYEHHKRWGDRNGAAHIKSALLGPGFSVPVEAGQLLLGTWQQIVLIDFDERPRQRRVSVRVVT